MAEQPMADRRHDGGADAARRALTTMVEADPERLRRRSIGRGVPPDDADDVAQTALLRAWRSIEHLEAPEPGRLCAWLDAIARNAAIDLARQRRRQPSIPWPEDVAAEHDVAIEVEIRVRLDRALQAIRDLPASLREPLLLSAADGLSADAIAQRLGLAPATVRQRISRARKALAACRGAGDGAH